MATEYTAGLAPRLATRRHRPVSATRHADLGKPAQVEHFVDLFGWKDAVAPHEIANQRSLAHRSLADLSRRRVADLRRERRCQCRRPLDPVLAHLAIRFD